MIPHTERSSDTGMQYVRIPCAGAAATVQASCFRGEGGVCECHLLVRPTRYAGVQTQLAWLDEAYRAALAALGLRIETAAWRRFFCSDLSNQAPSLADSPLAGRGPPDTACAVSCVQQPPSAPARVAMWAYHLHDPATRPDKHLDGPTLTWQRNGLTHCWTAGLAAPGAVGCHAQTASVFGTYGAWLESRNLVLSRHAVRTWVFVRDIDAHYEEMVAARREFFAANGLRTETHYIASTGIGGAGACRDAAVVLDAYAVGGLKPSQIRHLHAARHLCPTHLYGVTFERGTAVAYRDRQHVFISGTASIDSAGRLLHAGDVERQLDRALENFAALLQEAESRLSDLAVLLAYVRDPADQRRVCQLLRAYCNEHTHGSAGGELPVEVVVAPVCRPGWVVEVEGIATTRQSRPELPAF